MPSDSSRFEPPTSDAARAVTLEILSEILTPLRGLRSGSTMVTLHDSQVVQLKKNKKVRLQNKTGETTW